jgi:nucleoside-diphosphate-sugar epimerase
MPLDPILFMGGSGAIGQHTARALRAVHPDVPLLIGGRDLARAQQAAEQIGGALGVAIDPKADDLGLGDRQISAVVVFYMADVRAGRSPLRSSSNWPVRTCRVNPCAHVTPWSTRQAPHC